MNEQQFCEYKPLKLDNWQISLSDSDSVRMLTTKHTFRGTHGKEYCHR